MKPGVLARCRLVFATRAPERLVTRPTGSNWLFRPRTSEFGGGSLRCPSFPQRRPCTIGPARWVGVPSSELADSYASPPLLPLRFARPSFFWSGDTQRLPDIREMPTPRQHWAIGPNVTFPDDTDHNLVGSAKVSRPLTPRPPLEEEVNPVQPVPPATSLPIW